MTRESILEDINSNKSLNINNTLRPSKVLDHLAGQGCYKDIDDEFLKEIEYITGTPNGVYMSDNNIHFVVNAKTMSDSPTVEPIVSYELLFDKVKGRFKGFHQIIFYGDLESNDFSPQVLWQSDLKVLFAQVKVSHKGFIERAKSLGYLSYM